MTIPEDALNKHLNWLLESSDPDSDIHHLIVVAGAAGPFGIPDPDKLENTVYAIAWEPGGDDTLPTFTKKVILAAGVDHVQRGMRIVFAGLAQHLIAVSPGDDLSRRLAREGRMEEHPRAGEVTMTYAACSDGRRWRGRRWLTGPKAGQTEDVTLVLGPADQYEQSPTMTLLRRLVLVGI